MKWGTVLYKCQLSRFHDMLSHISEHFVRDVWQSCSL